MRLLVLVFGLFLAAPAHAQQTGAIRGWVGDGMAAALPGATFTVSTDGGVRVATGETDASGAFFVEPLVAGAYRVQLEHLGFEVARMHVYVAAKATARVATLLSIADWAKRMTQPTLRGTVLGADGRPVEGAFVRAVPIAPLRQSREDGVVTSDAYGRFELPAEMFGIYLFMAIAPGHMGTVVSHPERAGRERRAVEIRLQPLGWR